MKEKIIISVISSLLTAAIVYIITLSAYQITEKNVDMVVNKIIENENFNVKMEKIAENKFQDFAEQRVGNIEMRVDLLEQWTNENSNPKVIAMIRVSNQEVTYATDGVQYDKSTGNVTFLNPNEYEWIPLITHIKYQHYSTENHYVREILGKNKFRVWRTPRDTSNRNSAPDSFTAIVVAK